MGRNIDVLAGVVCFIQRYKFPFANSFLTTPAGKRTIINASKLAIPATPPLKGGEIYLAIFQVITIVFIIIALGSQFIKSVVSDRRAEYNDRIF